MLMTAEMMFDRLTKALNQMRSELMSKFDDADWKSYRYLVDWLRRANVGSNALQVGDAAPDFLLPDANGRLVSSEQLRKEGPLVISFYRGGWCPFCNAELQALQAFKSEFDKVGANVVVVSPETRDLPRQLKRQLGLDLLMLADVDHGVAMSFGILFRVPEETKAHYSAKGYDFAKRHGSTEWMLPVPATYIVDQDGKITSAFVEPDFTIRQEPSEIVEHVRNLGNPNRKEP